MNRDPYMDISIKKCSVIFDIWELYLIILYYLISYLIIDNML